MKMIYGIPAVLVVVICWMVTVGAAADEVLEVKEVAPCVYVHQGIHELPDKTNHGEIANIGFIVGDRCVAVIDTGGSPRQGNALRAAIQATTRIPVCYVINTHVHPDHIYGNKAFKQSGVIFVGHHKLAQAMAMRAPFYMEKAERDLGIILQQEDFIPPDRTAEKALELDLGGRRLFLTAHGTAHTDSDLSIFDEKTKTLWLSDLLFVDHIPVIDGSINGWLQELERLKTIQANVAIPGHGPVATDWPKTVEAELRYLNTLRSEIRTFIKNGKTMEQAMAEVAQSAKSDWQLFDEFHRRNIATAFAELEWEEF